jgi:hypothetical protein
MGKHAGSVEHRQRRHSPLELNVAPHREVVWRRMGQGRGRNGRVRNADGERRRGMEGDGRQLWSCRTDLWRVAWPRLTDLDLSRPIEVTTDMALSWKLGFPAYQNMADAFLDLFSALRADGIIS